MASDPPEDFIGDAVLAVCGADGRTGRRQRRRRRDIHRRHSMQHGQDLQLAEDPLLIEESAQLRLRPVPLIAGTQNRHAEA
ncbi:MAG: hypothetical protein AAGM22_11875 [Acidobacteriota bacterium]